MTPAELWYVYRSRMRARQTVVQELLAVLGIAVGVALLFASQVASTSLNGSVRQLTGEVIGSTQYQVQARGPQGFSSQLTGEMARIPGVVRALPILEQPATLVGPAGQQAVDLLGVSPAFLHAGGPLLHRFSARELAHQQAIALPDPVAAAIGVGSLQTVVLHIGSRLTQTLVGAALGEADVGQLVHSPVALAPLGYAQDLAGMSGRVSRVFVQARAGHESQVHAALAKLAAANHLNLEPASSEARQFDVAAGPENQSQGLFSAISALVGFLFAFNAMLLTVAARRHLIDVLRLRGSTRAMTVQMLIFEALVLGMVACVIGLALGDLLSIEVFHSKPGYLAFAFPVGSPRIVTWQTVAISVGAGMLAALIGVLAPMRDIIKPTLARDAPLRRWSRLRPVVGVAGVAATTAIVIARPQSAVVGMCTLMLALVCLLPSLFDGVVKAFAAMQRLIPIATASPRLAMVELADRSTRVRSLAVAATGAIAVFGAVSIQGSKHNLQEGLNRTATEVNDTTDLWVSPSGQANALGTTPFAASAVASRLRRLPGVRAVSIYRGGFLTVGDRRVWVLAPPLESSRAFPTGQVLTGDPRLAADRLRNGGWAVLSEALADELHLHIGQRFTLPAPHPMTLRLAALSSNMGWPPGAIILSSNDYAHAWGSAQASALNIALSPGTTPQHGRHEVASALGRNPGLTVQTAQARAQSWRTITSQGLGRLSQIANLVLIAAVLAIAGVMGSMIWQRKPHIAYIKRQGYPTGMLWRTLLWECVLLVITGCFGGAVFGVYGQLVLSHALVVVTGFPVLVSVGLLIPLLSGAIVSVSALAILAVPGYLAARVPATIISPA